VNCSALAELLDQVSRVLEPDDPVKRVRRLDLRLVLRQGGLFKQETQGLMRRRGAKRVRLASFS
jgi:hypothetical protein